MAVARNPNLKKANENVELTMDDIVELERCSTDPVHFCQKYVKIQHPTRGAISFDLYPYQEDMLEMFNDNRYSICLSARQTGKCVTGDTLITIGMRPRFWFKKLLLRIIDRSLYNMLYGNDKSTR